ncbi:MAG: aldose 1-epimerase family protein [Armatimonadota bacterium]
MVKLFGKEYTKDELLSKVGDISQIGGVRLIDLSDGVERGVRAAEFRTGSGLNFTVLIDRGLDISTAEYNGQSLAWKSSIGDKSPAYYEEPGLGWLRNFAAGLLVTCGLTYVGSPCEDEGKSLGIHGRISNIPASNIYADGAWQDDGSYEMWIQGKLRETVVFGENVQMERRISVKLGENKIHIHDKVTNLGYQDTEHMILYHINGGFPVVDAGTRLVAPVKECKPRDADAEDGKEEYDVFPDPIPGFYEKVYYLDLAEDADGFTCAGLINKSFNNGQGLGMYVKFPKKELPKFIEWKNPAEQVYVVGIEPSNCWVGGRDKEREQGTLQFLKPGETREYHVEIGVLTSQEEIKAFEESVKAAL